jgi:hypothetical protein
MNLELTDDETAALGRLLSDAIDRDRYPAFAAYQNASEAFSPKSARNRNANPCHHPSIMNRRERAAIGDDEILSRVGGRLIGCAAAAADHHRAAWKHGTETGDMMPRWEIVGSSLFHVGSASSSFPAMR